MNNRQKKQCSQEHNSEINDDTQSSKQTMEQSNFNYESLLKEIDMKSSALTKASNLIEILQIQVLFFIQRQLEVQKQSKKQAVLNISSQYEKQIENLRSKIQFLESLPERGILSRSQNQHKSQTRISSKSGSKSLNRCSSNDKKSFNKSLVQSPIQMNIYKKMLIQSSIRETLLLDKLKQIEKQEFFHISNIISKMEQFQNEILLNFQRGETKVKTFGKFQQIMKVVSDQNVIIEEMKAYQTQLEDLIKAFTSKIESLFDGKSFTAPSNDTQFITEMFKEVIGISKTWVQQKSKKEKQLEDQNKELRAIVEEMIGLMNKKKSNGREYRTLAN